MIPINNEDQRILVLRQQYRKLTQDYDLETPVWIGSSLEAFQPEEFFDGLFSMPIPVAFTNMSPEMASQKYLSENRPNIIKTNIEGSINFTFQLVHDTDNEPRYAIDTVKQEMNRVLPQNVIYDTGTGELSLTLYDAKLYFDETPVTMYWTPSFIWEYFCKDIDTIEIACQKQIARLRNYEMRMIKNAYADFLFQIEHKMLAEYSEMLLALAKDSNLKIDPTFAVLFGEHMSKTAVLRKGTA